MKRFGVEGGTRKRCPRENRRGRGAVNCDRALDSRDKK